MGILCFALYIYIYANVLHLDGLKNSIWVHHSVGFHLLLWGAMSF